MPLLRVWIFFKRGTFIQIKFSSKNCQEFLKIMLIWHNMIYNVNFGSYFTLPPGLLCQHHKFSECGKLTYNNTRYHWKIQLFFKHFCWKIVGGHLLERRHLLQQIRNTFIGQTKYSVLLSRQQRSNYSKAI